MMMLIDAFAPEGVTRLAVDSIFMMPHLGVLAQVNEKAAQEVFERDCLVYLGTCVSPLNRGKSRGKCFDYELSTPAGVRSGTVAGGEIILEPLEADESAEATFKPASGVDLGAGRGKEVQATVHGGVVGVVMDGRGRPLDIPKEDRKSTVAGWAGALKAYGA